MCCIVYINIHDKKDIGHAKKRSYEVDGEVALPVSAPICRQHLNRHSTGQSVAVTKDIRLWDIGMQ